MLHPSAGPWYAIRTRSNYELTIMVVLNAKGYETFVPLCKTRKQWSDRVVEKSTVLFPGYVFCRFEPNATVSIVNTPGVASIVGFGGKLAPIPDDQIGAVKAVINSGCTAMRWPYVREGQRVQVVKGVLSGLTGLLVRIQTWKVIISVDVLSTSVAVEVDVDYIAPI